jgi:hypothetical protein
VKVRGIFQEGIKRWWKQIVAAGKNGEADGDFWGSYWWYWEV